MNATTKKLLIFGGIVAVIIIFIALKKKQDDELPQLGDDIAGGKGPAVGTAQPLTWFDANIVPFGNGNQNSESGQAADEATTSELRQIGLLQAQATPWDPNKARTSVQPSEWKSKVSFFDGIKC